MNTKTKTGVAVGGLGAVIAAVLTLNVNDVDERATVASQAIAWIEHVTVDILPQVDAHDMASNKELRLMVKQAREAAEQLRACPDPESCEAARVLLLKRLTYMRECGARVGIDASDPAPIVGPAP